MWKRASTAIVVAVVAVAATASAQTTSAAAGSQQPATTSPQGRSRRAAGPGGFEHDDTGRNPARDHHLHGGHGAVVRADGRSAAGEALVLQRVPRELRLQPGLHRRIQLADHLRCRGWAASVEIFGAVQARPAHRPRRPADLLQLSQGGGVANEYPFVRRGWSGQPARRRLGRREGQPRVPVRQKPVAFGLRGWSSCRPRRTTTRASAPGSWTSPSTPSSARKSTSGSSSRASAGSSSAASRTTSRSRTASAGASALGCPTPQEPAADRRTARRGATPTIRSRCRRSLIGERRVDRRRRRPISIRRSMPRSA